MGKKIASGIRKALAVICFLGVVVYICTAFFEQTAASSKTPLFILAAVFAGLGVLLWPKKRGQQKKAQKRADKESAKRTMWCEHATGLPLSAGAKCVIMFDNTGISISGSGNSFTLGYDKITDMAVKTDVEIQKAYVSSIGGAVGGAVLFGPLGAMIGGRAKQKTSKITEYYFIVTYNNAGAVDYLSFRIFDMLKAAKMIEASRASLMGNRQVIDLGAGVSAPVTPQADDQYVILATLDGDTCPVCGEMDSKVFNQSEYAEGRTAPPFHEGCRCCTAPYFADMQGTGSRAARGADGKTISVPGGMTYADYKKKYLD